MLHGKKDYMCGHKWYKCKYMDQVHIYVYLHIYNCLKYFLFKYSICKTCLGKKGLKITEMLILVVFNFSNPSTKGKYHFYNQKKS